MIPPAARALDALAMSGLWTAAARASESQRVDKLFSDPWAMLLAGRQAVDDFDRAIAQHGAGTADLYAVITHFFDDFLLRLTGSQDAQQVVLIAAGLDARAFRLSLPRRTRLFEIDQPQVIAYKDRIFSLAGVAPGCERRAVGVDLNDSWADALCQVGFSPSQRSVWILEGFLYFLAESAVRNLLGGITALAASGSSLGLDVVNADMLTSRSTRHWSRRMAAIGTPWLFTSDDPAALLAEFGWSAVVVETGEKAVSFGRRPYSVAARGAPGAPRSFLVTATRD